MKSDRPEFCRAFICACVFWIWLIGVFFFLMPGHSASAENTPCNVLENQSSGSDTLADTTNRPWMVVSPDSLINLDLEEVVISAQRVPVRHSEIRRSVQVLDRRHILESPANDLADLLSGVRSVDVRHRGSYGMQSDVSIRGGTFDQTLVLLNGVNVTDPQTGHHNLNVPVDLQSIERIEVLHGPGARIFGPNAFNGAINIITKEPGDPQVKASVSAGQHRFGSAGILAGFATGPVSHHLSLHGMRSDGFTDNTDFRTGNVFYRSQLSFDYGRVDLQAGYNDKAFGANSFYSPRFPDQFEQTRAGFASLRWLPEGSVRITPVVYWRRHHDRFELFRQDAPDWYEDHNYHQTDIVGVSLNWVHTSSLGATSAGFDFRYEHIYSNVLGESISEKRPVPWEDAWFTHAYARNGMSLMLEQSKRFGNVSLSAGTLLYTNSDLDSPFTLFPGMDIGWRFHEHGRWYFTANRTLRLPTFTDLFYSGPDNLGNPDLKPEEAISFETGLKSTLGGLRFDVAFFRRQGSNMIDWVRRPDDSLWHSENLTKVTTNGFETGVEIPLHFMNVLHRSGVARRRNSSQSMLVIQYAYIHAEKSSGDFISNYALDHLRHKLDFSLSLPLSTYGGMQTTVIWQDRAGDFLHYDNGEYIETRGFQPFWTVDMKVYHRQGPIRLFAEASNLLNTTYMDIPNVPQPGRWMRAGMEVSL